MTRIIGGVAGSRQLTSPAKSTRPTSDRIREAVFNRLEARELISNASVLDLYAGTGALALEAMSRGAAKAMLVEKDGKAAAVCIKNAQLITKALEKEGRGEFSIRVAHKAVNAFLIADDQLFDLVFIDPPYEVTNQEVHSNLQALEPKLSANAVIILERSSRSAKPELPTTIKLDDEKSYGDTTIYWLSKN
jgi:16S rRNA (guanine966-N2)-methyltransferase